MVAIALLYCLLNVFKLSATKIIIIAIILYVIGVCGSAYQTIFLKIPLVGEILQFYLKVFATTRNGMFFGFVYVVIGYYIKKHENRIRTAHYWRLAIGFFIMMFIENFIAKKSTNHIGPEMNFSILFTVIFLFLALCFIEIKTKYFEIGKFCANLLC